MQRSGWLYQAKVKEPADYQPQQHWVHRTTAPVLLRYNAAVVDGWSWLIYHVVYLHARPKPANKAASMDGTTRPAVCMCHCFLLFLHQHRPTHNA